MPNSNTLYDYYYDAKKDHCFKSWNQKIEEFVYDKELPYFALMVPTIDTTRFAYCLEKLLLSQTPIFFTGSSGVGKSVLI